MVSQHEYIALSVLPKTPFTHNFLSANEEKRKSGWGEKVGYYTTQYTTDETGKKVSAFPPPLFCPSNPTRFFPIVVCVVLLCACPCPRVAVVVHWDFCLSPPPAKKDPLSPPTMSGIKGKLGRRGRKRCLVSVDRVLSLSLSLSLPTPFFFLRRPQFLSPQCLATGGWKVDLGETHGYTKKSYESIFTKLSQRRSLFASFPFPYQKRQQQKRDVKTGE